MRESREMYLETIYVLTKENGPVHAIEVCQHMGFSKPSVSRAVGLLKQGGYVTADEDGHLSLTEAGREAAIKTYERHKVLTNFFIRLGIDEEIAAEDACKIEHDLSDTTFEAIKRHADSLR